MNYYHIRHCSHCTHHYRCNCTT